MHYENLRINAIQKGKDYWYVSLSSDHGGHFSFPVASSSVSEEELAQSGIFVGRSVVGAVINDKLVELDGISFIKSKSRGK